MKKGAVIALALSLAMFTGCGGSTPALDDRGGEIGIPKPPKQPLGTELPRGPVTLKIGDTRTHYYLSTDSTMDLPLIKMVSTSKNPLMFIDAGEGEVSLSGRDAGYFTLEKNGGIYKLLPKNPPLEEGSYNFTVTARSQANSIEQDIKLKAIAPVRALPSEISNDADAPRILEFSIRGNDFTNSGAALIDLTPDRSGSGIDAGNKSFIAEVKLDRALKEEEKEEFDIYFSQKSIIDVAKDADRKIHIAFGASTTELNRSAMSFSCSFRSTYGDEDSYTASCTLNDQSLDDHPIIKTTEFSDFNYVNVLSCRKIPGDDTYYDDLCNYAAIPVQFIP